jgi:Rad3-related DNA helicase
LLREQQNLYFSTVTITAKEKLCPLEKADCNPDACPYAKGHFDRVNDAVFEIIHAESGITRETILRYAEKYQVCPFEFCLDISNWVDGIICDYNYVFDPNAKLARYFSDTSTGDYIFLIDEAHNLVSRAREMFSAVLIKEDFLLVKKVIRGRNTKLERALDRCNRSLLELKRECEHAQVIDDCHLFSANLLGMYSEMEDFLDDEKEFPERDTVLQFYFDVRHFLNMYEGLGDHYRIYTQMLEDGRFMLRLFCIDPSGCLKACLEKGIGSVFFSATLLPVLYYKKLLSGNPEDYAVYAHSPFPEENRQLLIASDVSSRYTRRNPQEYAKVIDYIRILAGSHRGNYMVFFPSYAYMEAVNRQMQECCQGEFIWKMQDAHMGEAEREEFLADFEQPHELSYLALCVLGGIFSEGIDLTEDRLEGTIIVGTGLPMVCTEQEILKTYFEEHGEDGYNYAYQYPGMNKVLQAAGRVIRTPTDRGVILLLDDRFLRPDLQALFPREWNRYVLVNRHNVGGWLEKFW